MKFVCLSFATIAAVGLAALPVQSAPFTLTHSVDNPEPGDNDRFGWTVDVSDGTAIVSAYRNDVGGQSENGSAYLVDTATGAVTHTLVNPSTGDFEWFGNAVAIDGSRAAVGAPLISGASTHQGEAHVVDVATGAITTTLINPNGAGDDGDRFGQAIGISGDLVVVGALFEDTGGLVDAGSAYLFDAVSGVLEHTLLDPTPNANDLFGWAVAVDDNFVAVSASLGDPGGVLNAGEVHVYDTVTGNLLSTLVDPNGGAGDQFGFSIDIDNGQVLVGSTLDDPGGASNAGQAFLFDAMTGSLLQTFDNPDPTDLDLFGRSVDLSDGIAVIGTVFDDPGAVTNAGSVYLFDALSGGLIQSIPNPNPMTNDIFGGVTDAVSLDNGTLVIGAYGVNSGADRSGRVYIYNDVPAPGTIFILIVGFAGFAGLRRRTA